MFACKDRIGYTYVFNDEFCDETFADASDAVEAAEAEHGEE